MARTVRTGLASFVLGLTLAACSDGGGDRAAGVQTGPVPPNGPVEPPPPQVPSTEVDAGELGSGDQVVASMTGVTLNSPPTVTFTLVANGQQRVTGLDSSMLLATQARLRTDDTFDGLDWVSLIGTTEDPLCRNADDLNNSNNQCETTVDDIDDSDPDTISQARKVQDPVATGITVQDQATSESGGELRPGDDGDWVYTLTTDPGDPATLETMHRVCIQFSLNAPTNNACIDFVPQDLADPAIGERATSLDDNFYQNYDSQQIVADASCNSCHARVAIHGGGRTAMDYCVTCHNPGSTDANSENSVDFKQMVHRIHNGRNLPSNSGDEPVPYKIWGFNNGEHDYSNLSYPQKIIQCARCHAGQEDFDYAEQEGLPAPHAEITPDGHRWVTYAARVACESCHDDKLSHGSGGSAPCVQCHANVQESHRDSAEELGRSLSFAITSIDNTEAGDSPVIQYTLSSGGEALDVTQFDGSLKLDIAFDAATDYVNTGFSIVPVEVDAVANATAVGDRVFQIDTGALQNPFTVPAGIDTLAVSLVGFENPRDEDNEITGTAAITSLVDFAGSSSTTATSRREVVDMALCNDCHHRLEMTDTAHKDFHAAPTDNDQVCVTCHGPNLGFSSEGTDFRVLVHGLHASGIRQTPYKGFTEEQVQFPGNLADCQICHLPGTQTLPMPVPPPPIRDGEEGLYSTPQAATCASCHDGDSARSHMVSSGGALFQVAQDAAGTAIETCDVCHKSGASASVEAVHNK